MVAMVSKLLAWLTAGGMILIAGLLVNKWGIKNKVVGYWLGKYQLLVAWLVAVAAVSGSLFYSEVAGYIPCKLCWFERILMYPQVILLGMAWWMKDKSIVKYILVLSGLGVILAGYHYLLQMGVAPDLTCGVGGGLGCSQRLVWQWGFVTIPLMAAVAFLLIWVVMLGMGYKGGSNGKAEV